MGNGHALGTATGRGIAGAEAAIMGFGVSRRRIAGLAVFFFAAFLSAGFLAGFFLAGFAMAPGFLLAVLVADARFFLPGFIAAAFFLLADLRAAGFLGAAVFFRFVFFFAAFFAAFAMMTSDCVYSWLSCRCC